MELWGAVLGQLWALLSVKLWAQTCRRAIVSERQLAQGKVLASVKL